MYRFLISLSLFCLGPLSVLAQLPIGHWQSWLPTLPAIAVTQRGDKVYYASSSGLFSVTTDGEQDITRYSKINGLHDIGISTIASNENGVLVAYRNSNLDLLSGNNSYNLPYLQRKQTTIHHIYMGGTNAYLCTGLGVVVVNTTVPEVAATYAIGTVYGLTIQQNQLYAATEAGVLTALLTGSNPADYRNWSAVGQLTDTVSQIVSFAGQLICQQGRGLYILENGAWEPFYSPVDGEVAVQGAYLTICNKDGIVYLQSDGSAAGLLQFPLLKAPRQLSGDYIADSLSGLLWYDGQAYSSLAINGPAGIIKGNMLFYNNTLHAAAGNGYYTYQSGEWHPNADSISTLVPDPTGNGMYAGSYDKGLIHIAGNGTRSYSLQGYKVNGLTTDASGNLWIANDGAYYNLLCMKPDGSFLTFRNTNAQAGQLIADDAGQIWMVSNGLSIYNPATNQWTQQSNLPSAVVNCIAKDKNGSFWVGTNAGIAVVGCNGCTAVWPIIKQDNFAGYLFQDEQVTAIAVDGANRKWVGTHNGVWLVNEDGTSIAQGFTTDNSPLPGNYIYSIAINPVTGEVYFSTDKGLMAYRGNATEGQAMSSQSALVFPNPVAHDYTGTIAIRGLAENSIVKITDITGRVVHATRSNGGQATWNGLDGTGHRPQTGVYLVFASNTATGEHLVAKIVFIN